MHPNSRRTSVSMLMSCSGDSQMRQPLCEVWARCCTSTILLEVTGKLVSVSRLTASLAVSVLAFWSCTGNSHVAFLILLAAITFWYWTMHDFFRNRPFLLLADIPVLGVNKPVKTSKTCVATAAFSVNCTHRVAVLVPTATTGWRMCTGWRVSLILLVHGFTQLAANFEGVKWLHYNDVIMGAIASQITSLTIVNSTVYSGTDQRIHQSSTSLAFVQGIHRGPVNSPHKWPVTWKMFSFDDVFMKKAMQLW